MIYCIEQANTKQFKRKITKKKYTFTINYNGKNFNINFLVFYCKKNKKGFLPFKKISKKYNINTAVMPDNYINNNYIKPYPVNNFLINKINSIYKQNYNNSNITFINKNGEFLTEIFNLLKFFKQINIFTLNYEKFNKLCQKSFINFGTEPILVPSFFDALNNKNCINLDDKNFFVLPCILDIFKQIFNNVSVLQLSAAVYNEINKKI